MKIEAKVIRGSGRGHEIGFPTVNLEVLKGDLPNFGVYSSYLTYKGENYESVLHYGPRKTFHDDEASLEVHILDFDEDIYGKELEVEFLDKIREVKQFDGIEALKAQIIEDIEYAKKKFNM